ncbi:MAG: hypothetical protein ACYS9X_32935, partial [Planctomycetota bacterium]
MREIAIHEIESGQTLAVDVFDERGGLLLSKGILLSSEHAELLEKRGVLAVSIAEPAEDAAPGRGAPGDTREFEKALGRLDHMFEGFEEDPVMRAIYAAARRMIES